MHPIRVLIADDHPEIVSALVSVLDYDPRFRVVGTAGTGQVTLEVARAGSPDLVVLDVSMPGGGPKAAHALATLPDAPAVVALSAHSRVSVVEAMLRAGAVGFLTKGAVGNALPDLLHRCAEGEVVLATTSASQALRAVLREPAAL